MRVRGIGAIPATLPAIKPQAPRATLVVEQRVRRAAIEVGLSEALAMSFASPRQIAALGLPPAFVALQNPLGEERGVMRTSLLPGLLDSLLRARRHGVTDVRLFQIGARFLAPRGGDGPDARLPVEARSFAAVVTGKRDAVLTKPEDVDVYDAKGLAVAIAERATLRPVTVRHQPVERRAPYLHPRAAGELLVEGTAIGVFGLLHPDVGDLFEIEPAVVVVEIDVDALEAIGRRTPQYRPIPTLPAATRDLALVVAEEVTAGAIEDEIRASGGALCESVDLFDLFAGQGIPEGHRSLAFHVVYRDPKASTDPEKARTLTDAEIDKQHAAVIAAVSRRFGAELRG
jgi:phenylalanyl-tRNA synthetase beta chain